MSWKQRSADFCKAQMDAQIAYIEAEREVDRLQAENDRLRCLLDERDVEMCHDKNGFDPDTGFECTVCGTMVDSYMITPADTGHEMQFHYCPSCGRVVNDG